MSHLFNCHAIVSLYKPVQIRYQHASFFYVIDMTTTNSNREWCCFLVYGIEKVAVAPWNITQDQFTEWLR
ncbi:hypothetical protein [Vibrio parahaemolyticus]|uniref:hypothetical protein n=1 Tax=Vibrio parahaemolyticus TaxID=670 RepID=UPI002360DBEB|nr:hypothetical protein [Vibrio parahaemolyticus]